jgi:hypothetical protein
MYSAVAAAEHGEVAKMPAELVENEGQRERDGPGADGRRGARLAGTRKGSPTVDRVREIPCPAPPRFARRSAHCRFGFADPGSRPRSPLASGG